MFSKFVTSTVDYCRGNGLVRTLGVYPRAALVPTPMLPLVAWSLHTLPRLGLLVYKLFFFQFVQIQVHMLLLLFTEVFKKYRPLRKECNRPLKDIVK